MTRADQQVMRVEEIPSEVVVPEDVTYSETIEVEGKPRMTKPRQFEIRVGVPKAPGPTPTTAEVLKETTTYTTITSEMHAAPEEIPQIKEGQETRTTTITFDKQLGKQPVELTVQVPEKPKKSDVIGATELSTTTVTKEMRIKETEDLESAPETHTETIEIIKDTQPQEVQLHFEIPEQKPETTAVTVDTDALTATKHIEVEIQEAVMQQKPKTTKIVIPKPEIPTTEMPTQVEAPRPVVEQIEEIRPTIEKVTKVIPEQAKPQQQEIVFEIPAKQEIMDEITPIEVETPAPFQPEEVVEREVITVKPVPETETKAPEIEMKISERDTIQIVKEPVEETVKFEIEVSESAPEVTETVTTETVTEKTVLEQEVPQVVETHKEEITLDVKGKPMEEVQLSFQVQPTEKQSPETKEIQIIEKTSETVTETIQLPEVEETPQKEVTVITEEKPVESVTMTIDVKEVETTEIEEVTTTEKPDITKEEEMAIPAVTETRKEEMTIEYQEKPREEVQFTIQVQPEKGAPVTEVVQDVEQVTLETKETVEVQLPQIEETERKEIPIDVTDRPSEEVTMTIQIGEKEVPEIKETTKIETTEITQKFETEVPEIEERPREEIPVGTEERPLAAVQFQVQIPDKEVPETEETTQIETTETTKTFTIQVPEVEERHKEEITIDTHERPTEAVQFQVQIGEIEVPEKAVVTETETTETVTKIIELPSVEETHRDEITLDIGQKPKAVQMEIEVPTDIQETITFTTEVTEEAPEATPEVRETTREEITLEIKGEPVEMKEMEIKIPVRPKEEAETSPKQTSPLQAPTTEEIFETFEQGTPEFTWGLVNLKVMDGEEAKFRCEVQANPTPDISWFHDEKPIAENQDFR